MRIAVQKLISTAIVIINRAVGGRAVSASRDDRSIGEIYHPAKPTPHNAVTALGKISSISRLDV